MPAPDPHTERIGFGKHRGRRFVELPVGYLRWMVNASTRQADVAQIELERRGTPLPQIEVKPHAVDRASLRCRRQWHRFRNKGEGLYSWLARIGAEALETEEPDDRGRYQTCGIRLVVERDGQWPVIVSVLPGKGICSSCLGTGEHQEVVRKVCTKCNGREADDA